MTLAEFYSERLDDREREQWISLWQYEQDTCRECGQQRSVCSDPEQAFYPQRNICYATAAQRTAQRRYEALAKRANAPEGALDGDTIWVSTDNLTPDDDFLQEGIEVPERPDDEVVT